MDDQLLNEFINESREHLASIEANLLAVEEGGANVDEDLVNKVFRAAHSIKGGSAFFGLNQVKELAHKAETVLDMIRSGKMIPNAEITNVLLAAFDKLREMINNPATQAQVDITELVVALSGLASSYLPPEQKDSLSANVELHAAGEDKTTLTLPQVDFERAKRSSQYVYCVDLDLIHDLERKGKNILNVFRDIWETGEILDCVINYEAVGTLDGPLSHELPLRLAFATIIRPDDVGALIDVEPQKLKVLLDPGQPSESPAITEAQSATPEPSRAAPPAQSEIPPQLSPVATPKPPAPTTSNTGTESRRTESSTPPETRTASTAGDSTLRVNVSLLETLMNLAGELVLSRNQLRAAVAHKDSQSLSVADQRLSQVTSDLQDAIMRTRLQPIGNVFGKFPRVVRDMASLLKKDIQLDIRGKEVALDRSLIEGLSDPLTHMLRNAVDHGVESPDERIRLGKRPQAIVRIEARHEAGQVVVEIADDGRGINPQRVVDSALSKGLITPERVRGMSDQDKIGLIMLPGLSTASKITDVSGRGVGMDVVKTNLERLGGKIEIKSELGKGSLFRIKLPLTLAIIPSLIVSARSERYAIPQINVEELLRIPTEEIGKRIEVVGGAKVLLLRDQIIPLVHLDTIFAADKLSGRTSATPVESSSQSESKALEIAVVTTGALQYGLVVDTFHETEEIVVKPLGRHLKGLGAYAGATILGDGTVALILDVAGVALKAELAAVAAAVRAREQANSESAKTTDESWSYLLFNNGTNEACATPLETVLRVERISADKVESVGGRRTMQYRGSSLPLVSLADAASVQSLCEARELAVIVSTVHGREVGMLGTLPVDVVEVKTKIDASTHRQPGITGSAIINDKTTLIVDIFELVAAVFPDWKESNAAVAGNSGEPGKTGILLAEDSDFFRAQVKKYLEQDGFTVFDAPDGDAAWQLLGENSNKVGAVVTDIEMPFCTGLELTQRIRGDDRFAKLPVIAVSSLAGEDDVARSKAAGVDEHLVKLDRDQLLSAVHGILEHR